MKKGKTLGALKETTSFRDADVRTQSVEAPNSMTHGIIRESQVDVLYMMTPDERRFIRVKVWSLVKKGLFRYSDIFVAGNSQTEMIKKCGMVAGVCAEGLIAQFKDLVDPSECARKAGQHFRELVEFINTSRASAVASETMAQDIFSPENLQQYGETELIVPPSVDGE